MDEAPFQPAWALFHTHIRLFAFFNGSDNEIRDPRTEGHSLGAFYARAVAVKTSVSPAADLIVADVAAGELESPNYRFSVCALGRGYGVTGDRLSLAKSGRSSG